MAIVLCVGQAMVENAQAQQKGWGEKEGKLEEAVINVEKNVAVELPEAPRNFEKFRIDPPQPAKDDVTYRFTDYKMPGQEVDVNMRVLTIKQDDLPKLLGNYVKLGFGNYATPYLKGYFHNTRSKDYSIGADVSHISSANGPVERGGENISGVSNSSVGLHGESFQRNMTLGGRLHYGHDRYKFYGFSPAIEQFSEDSIQQVFNRVTAEGYLNNYQDSRAKLQYQAGVNFSLLKDNFEASETNFGVNLKTDYFLDKISKISVKTDFAYASHKDSVTNTRPFFKISPTYQRDMDKLDIEIGATIGYTGDTINDARKFNFYPVVKASYEVVEGKVLFFAGLEGDLQRNTLYKLTEENPYLAPNVIVADINKNLDVNAGISLNLANNVHLLGKVSYRNYRNLYFFNNSVTDSSKFAIWYDNGSTSAVNVYADLAYTMAEKFRFGTKIDYTNYSTETLDHPYHRPSMWASVYSTFNLYNKILLNAELYYISSSFGSIYRPQTGTFVDQETDNIVDLNLKGDYRFSNKFSAFLMFNNLFGNKYERFVNYPTKGINVIGGISYSF